jgi:O-antigen/teichoic acid export membrane protein
MALVAAPLVEALFGEKWIDAASVIPPISIYTLLISISFNMGDAFKALDRPDVLLRLSILRGVIALPTLIGAAVWIGTATAVGWAQAALALFSVAATLTAAKWVFDLPVADVLRNLLPTGAACGVMAIGVWCALAWSPFDDCWALLAVAVPTGAVCYGVSLRAFAPEFFEQGIKAVRDALSRRPRLAEGAA